MTIQFQFKQNYKSPTNTLWFPKNSDQNFKSECPLNILPALVNGSKEFEEFDGTAHSNSGCQSLNGRSLNFDSFDSQNLNFGSFRSNKGAKERLMHCYKGQRDYTLPLLISYFFQHTVLVANESSNYKFWMTWKILVTLVTFVSPSFGLCTEINLFTKKWIFD